MTANFFIGLAIQTTHFERMFLAATGCKKQYCASLGLCSEVNYNKTDDDEKKNTQMMWRLFLFKTASNILQNPVVRVT